MPPIVRFAPSPTGFLHIGGARTALFNWLYAKHHGGTFLLRVEDTDRARSTPESVETIFDGLRWLGLDWDGEAVSQFARKDRHAEVAQALLERGAAYYCYASPEELEALRAEQKAAGLPQRYDGRWRDRPASDAPPGVKPVIRLKAPRDGATTLTDAVMGTITVPNAQLDDMVLLRADGTPTYMLAVVVDDHDMGVTHVIRGDDHLTNTFRQVQILRAMGLDTPVYAHLPMILGPDGAKLSKRHGAPAVSDYRARGYLPEAVRNYLLRLCWSHGDDELISTEQAIQWFDLDGVGTSPARFDFAKLGHVNAHYINQTEDAALAALVAPFVTDRIGRDLTAAERALLTRAMPDIKPRATTLVEAAEATLFYFAPRPLALEAKAAALLTPDAKNHLAALLPQIEALTDFSAASLEQLFRAYATEKGLKLGAIAQPLRAALTGSTVSPPIFTAAALLGRDDVMGKIKDITA